MGKLGGVAGQTRSICHLKFASLVVVVIVAKINDIIKADKLLRKAKQEIVFLKFGKKEKFRIVCFNYASLSKLKDGGSQGGFYKISLLGTATSVLLLCGHQRRIAISVMVAKTFVQVHSEESCFWLANLLNEILYPNPSKETLAKIECRTDNYQLYDAILSIRPIQDKRLRIKIELLRKMLNRKD